MSSREFELLVQKLFAQKLNNTFGQPIKVDHLKQFKSFTGNLYEIDVSYSFNLENMNYLTLVECKYWNNYVTREKIGYFKAIIDDLKAHKGIVVTSKGFQKGAVSYAKSQGIGLVKIVNDLDFETVSHFNGDLNWINDKLIEKDIFFEPHNYTSVGLFSPNISIYHFIKMHYGQELGDFLENNFTKDYIDVPDQNLKYILTQQIAKMPTEWCDDYLKLETAGLNYPISNESLLRILNLLLLLLQNPSS